MWQLLIATESLLTKNTFLDIINNQDGMYVKLYNSFFTKVEYKKSLRNKNIKTIKQKKTQNKKDKNTYHDQNVFINNPFNITVQGLVTSELRVKRVSYELRVSLRVKK